MSTDVSVPATPGGILERTQWGLKAAAPLAAGPTKILWALVFRAGIANEAYPGLERLCADTGLKKSTVRYGLNDLLKRGLIRRVGGGHRGRAATYRLCYEKVPVQTDTFHPPKGASLTPKGASLTTERCQSHDGKVLVQTAPNQTEPEERDIQPARVRAREVGIGQQSRGWQDTVADFCVENGITARSHPGFILWATRDCRARTLDALAKTWDGWSEDRAEFPRDFTTSSPRTNYAQYFPRKLVDAA